MYQLQTYIINILFMLLSIILLIGQQTEPPRSLSKPRNSHINRRRIKITHHCHYDKN